jgi:hypothetical protein
MQKRTCDSRRKDPDHVGEKGIKQGATLVGSSHRLRPSDYPNVVRKVMMIASVASVCVKGRKASSILTL